jgi:hypothetical protein
MRSASSRRPPPAILDNGDGQPYPRSCPGLSAKRPLLHPSGVRDVAAQQGSTSGGENNGSSSTRPEDEGRDARLHPSGRDDHRPDRSLHRPAAAYDLTAGGAVGVYPQRRKISPGRDIAALGHIHARDGKPRHRRPINQVISAPVAVPKGIPSDTAAAPSHKDDRAARRPFFPLRQFDQNEFDAVSAGRGGRRLIAVAVIGKGNLSALVSAGLHHFGQASDFGAAVSALPLGLWRPCPAILDNATAKLVQDPAPVAPLEKPQARTTSFRRGALRQGSTNRRQRDG